jgi:hypothetical protein
MEIFILEKMDFFIKKMGGAGGRKNPALGVICNAPQDLNNRYIVGAIVGASSMANRRALRQRATRCSQFCK